MKYLIFVLALFGFLKVDAAILGKFSGEVTVNNKMAKIKMELKVGDTVEAKGKKSYAVVDFGAGTKSIVTNGSVKITKVSNKQIELNLIKGLISTALEKDQGNNFSIKTKNAVLGVRGTKFLVDYSKENTYLCVCEGRVEIKNKVASKIVKREEDTNISSENQKSIVTSDANSTMWKMSVKQFGLMGVTVKPRS